MSVQNQIDRIKTAVEDAYTSIEEKGGTIPTSKTVANLANSIDSITSGNIKWGSIGGNILDQLDLNSALGEKSDKIVSGTISLLTANWTGSTSPYAQTITITGSTTKSMINLQMDSSLFSKMLSDGTLAMYVENNEGVLTVYALGNKPNVDLSVQYTRVELS